MIIVGVIFLLLGTAGAFATRWFECRPGASHLDIMAVLLGYVLSAASALAGLLFVVVATAFPLNLVLVPVIVGCWLLAGYFWSKAERS